MKEKPILFSAPMVRAILDGRKTQTRREVKLKNGQYIPPSLRADTNGWKQMLRLCPYGQPGDRLWVRETWAPEQIDADAMTMQAVNDSVRMPAYRADFHGNPAYKWRPSIHMPRWASRILLEIAAVRVERLNGISHDDACAEGIESTRGGKLACVDRFRSLWEQSYGTGSWAANPWVWVVEFRRI